MPKKSRVDKPVGAVTSTSWTHWIQQVKSTVIACQQSPNQTTTLKSLCEHPFNNTFELHDQLEEKTIIELCRDTLDVLTTQVSIPQLMEDRKPLLKADYLLMKVWKYSMAYLSKLELSSGESVPKKKVLEVDESASRVAFITECFESDLEDLRKNERIDGNKMELLVHFMKEHLASAVTQEELEWFEQVQ